MCGVRAQRDCAVRGVSAILLSGAKNLNRKRRSLDGTLYTCSMNANGSGGCDGGPGGALSIALGAVAGWPEIGEMLRCN